MKGRGALLLTVSILGLPSSGCAPSPDPGGTAATAAAAARTGQVARGEYLVKILACHDCHTPYKMGPKGPEPDMTLALSGHPESLVMPPAPVLQEGPWMWVGAGTNTAFAGPWGVSYAINLTPDASGLAAWDEDIFMRTMRSGRHWGTSRPILPPMPWPWYGQMTDEDLRAVFAYLRTLPPIRNRVPEAVPSEMFLAGSEAGGEAGPADAGG